MDRLGFLKEAGNSFHQLPPFIRTEIIYKYLFPDIFDSFPRFFSPKSKKSVRADEPFLVDIATGLKPRKFSIYDKNDYCDQLIYEENQEVAEMYFVVQGKVGVGINTYTNLCDKLEVGQKLPVNELICDFYIMHKKRSNFNYFALSDVRAFCITRKYMHEFLF